VSRITLLLKQPLTFVKIKEKKKLGEEILCGRTGGKKGGENDRDIDEKTKKTQEVFKIRFKVGDLTGGEKNNEGKREKPKRAIIVEEKKVETFKSRKGVITKKKGREGGKAG